jgi:hypothetical protein
MIYALIIKLWDGSSLELNVKSIVIYGKET